MSKKRSYKTLIFSMTDDQKCAVVGLVSLGLTPTTACERLRIPIQAYSKAYMSDKTFMKDIDSVRLALVAKAQDVMFERGISGNHAMLEQWLLNATRRLKNDHPLKWVPSDWVPADSNSANDDAKGWLNKLFEHQYERIKGQKLTGLEPPKEEVVEVDSEE